MTLMSLGIVTETQWSMWVAAASGVAGLLGMVLKERGPD